MKFLVYSSVNEHTIADSLGMADYSYYFVMRSYLPLLEKFGTVEVFSEPPDDGVITSRQEHDKCLYLSFSPPDKLAPITVCPVVVIFAWEFSTIPCEEFTKAEDNWVHELKILGCAITHSSYSVAVVRNQLTDDFKIESIPAPLWDSCESIRQTRKTHFPQGLTALEFNCRAIDSASYELSNTSIRPKLTNSDFTADLLGQEWQEEPIDLDFYSSDMKSSLIGFNVPEEWGVWSKPGYPWILLNELIEGHIELQVEVQGYGQNVGEQLNLQIGSAGAELLLTEHFATHVFNLYLAHPTNVIAFLGIIEKDVGMADPRDIGFGLGGLSIRRKEKSPGELDSLTVNMADTDIVHEGFHDAELWGRWSAACLCTVFLPRSVRGDIDLTLHIDHSLHNDGRTIEVSMGGEVQHLALQEGIRSYHLQFSSCCATNYIRIDGLRFGGTGNDGDARKVGIGLSKLVLDIKMTDTVLEDKSATPRHRLAKSAKDSKDNILYTAILNPMDARKNWEDIITAFVYAFRETRNVTLLMKISHHDFTPFFEGIFTFFTELHPFKCRLIFIHGFLSEPEYKQLMEHSHFIVNASTGEGQCLPLMEFMSAGVPAVAPFHSAMLDYVNPSNSFIVESSAEPTHWPQDPRSVFRTECQRINWESLRNAFVDSEKVFRRSRRRYLKMSKFAIDSLEKFCSLSVASEKMERFISGIEWRNNR